jgi:putative membrane protein
MKIALATLLAAGIASTALAQDTGGAFPATTGSPAQSRNAAATEQVPGATPVVPARGAVPARVPGARVGVAPAYGSTAGGMNDSLFAAAAASAGLAEVTMGQLASQRATSNEVRAFARQMIADHTKANQELQTLASQRGVAAPATLEIGDRAAENALSGAPVEKFDKCYIHQQLAAHMCAVALFEAEAERGGDPAMRAWAAKTLPVLKEHKMMVKRLHDDIEGPSARTTAPR